MSRELRLVLEDRILYCELIVEWSSRLTFDEFVAHPVYYHAILRALTVVGEASKQVPDDFRSTTPDILWQEIAGMRDIVVHRYFGVQDEAVWDVVTTEVPPLLAGLSAAIAALTDEG